MKHLQLNDMPGKLRFSCIRICATLLVATALTGCASTANPRDPLEPLNRAVYSFNDGFDRAIAKPIAEGYRSIVPALVRTGVGNFFSNLEDLWIAANNLLQGKVATAADDFGRFFLNSTFGLLGVMDVASDAGLEKHNEDFGQTLGRWGVGNGAYLVLPFLGPSTIRDAFGRLAVDAQADFVVQTDHVPTRNTLYTIRAIDIRASLLDASQVLDVAALDQYNFVRDAYLQRRRSLIFDGNPPKEVEPDNDTAPAADSGMDAGVVSPTAEGASTPERSIAVLSSPAQAGTSN